MERLQVSDLTGGRNLFVNVEVPYLGTKSGILQTVLFPVIGKTLKLSPQHGVYSSIVNPILMCACILW